MATAFLTERSLGRIVAGHPWVYASDLLRVEGKPEDGKEIAVRGSRGAWIGVGFFNGKSKIPIRILARRRVPLDEAFFRTRIAQAVARRRDGEGRLPSACRLVWSEGDFLPGLIVDWYAGGAVFQTLTRAMDDRREWLVATLRTLLDPDVIVERNEASSRAFEGLAPRRGIAWGTGATRREVDAGGLRMEADLLEGQKTGSYLDQAENWRRVAARAKGRRVLDAFTYHGGFALACAKAGATRVEGVDLSKDAVAACERGATRNGSLNASWRCANVFDDLNARVRARETFDLVILDPPSFTRSRARLGEARRGYKEIHLKALRLLGEGGRLATFCCSHHVTSEAFRAVALDAAFDERILLRQVEAYGQPEDHPVLPAVPETEYLKGFLFEVAEKG
ncbi:MAG: class I SAM-dependent rRNA methyltransferase [Verrucomicrobiae bacterium]|nr:class I SAM-dependent rRNA methyltransferase [Verrucomicrobiae bacterium]